MQRKLLNSLIGVALLWAIVGCESSTSTNSTDEENGQQVAPLDNTQAEVPTNVQTAIASSKSILSQELQDSITYMYSEEGLAYDVYTHIYVKQRVNQLQNIANNSELKHIEAVNQLAIKYDLNMTQYPDTEEPYSIDGVGNGVYPVETVQNLYTLLYEKGITSKQDALEVGCMVEVVDIDDLDKYIAQAEASNAPDVREIFYFLRKGSYTHYWSFDSGLKNMGLSKGCCGVEDALGYSFCHLEYPNEGGE